MKAKLAIIFERITLPFRYLLGLIILIGILPALIRELQTDEEILKRYIRN